jgi:hypothetical protein
MSFKSTEEIYQALLDGKSVQDNYKGEQMSFKSTAEIYQSLLQGNTLVDKYNNVVLLNGSGNQIVNNSDGKKVDFTFRFDNPEEWKLKESVITISVDKFSELFRQVAKDNVSVLFNLLTTLSDEGFVK